MTSEEIDEAIGKVVLTGPDWINWFVRDKHAHWPKYHSDLNAMHDAEFILKPKQWLGNDGYISRLQKETGSKMLINARKAIHATALQRAKAFLKTLNKWKD